MLKRCNGKMVLESKGEKTNIYYCKKCGLYEEIPIEVIEELTQNSKKILCKYTIKDLQEIEL